MRAKLGEVEYFALKLKLHRDLQRQAENPPSHEVNYNLSAFLNAARSLGKMMARKGPWWDQLGAADLALHKHIWNMRDETVYEGRTATIVRTEEIPVRPDWHHGSMFDNSLFGGVKTIAHNHAIELGGNEHDLVDLCGQYVAILTRALGNIEAGADLRSLPKVKPASLARPTAVKGRRPGF
jgi:hypothetical protein